MLVILYWIHRPPTQRNTHHYVTNIHVSYATPRQPEIKSKPSKYTLSKCPDEMHPGGFSGQ